MVSTVRVGENDDSEACDNILQIGHRLVRNGVQQVTVPKCLFNKKHQKTRSIRRLRGV